MNLSLFNANLLKNFWNIIVDFFNLIPKIIYFLYASLASCVDAMQLLVRKLAGLDVYYQSGSAVAGRDPLTEFIYGILGFGNNAATYKGLSTVFWSLVVFAVIVLAIATMVAIIKSHYNEDTAGTSPWKYIYQAIKAVLTFIAIPAVVLLGMRLNTFILSTLDTIISGNADKERIEEIYGANAVTKFKAGQLQGKDETSYIYYDYFGLGSATSTTTFSGMLFKAAAYNCNRLRINTWGIGAGYGGYEDVKVDGVSIFAAGDTFENTPEEDKQEYVAFQVDFAFQNNLHLVSFMRYENISAASGLSVYPSADLWMQAFVKSFTKFNPSLIWQFYDLWRFNFIVGFAGVFATFTIMTSIIIGLMSRLVKGTALFLIYPALLGLAPLDNFKAFKDWGRQFMQQILMAIGSIIGINLLLLILPYITSISFFNQPLIDAIINVLLLVTGLAMAKDFVQMVSTFVGGDNALTVGGGLKSEASANLKKGIGTTAKIGLGTARIFGAMYKHGEKRGHLQNAGHDANEARRKRKNAESEAANKQDILDLAISNRRSEVGRKANDKERKSIEKAEDDAEEKWFEEHEGKNYSNLTAKDAEEIKKLRDNAKNAKLDEIASDWDKNNRGNSDSEWHFTQKSVQDAEEARNKAHETFEKEAAKENAIVEKYGLRKKAGTDEYEDLTDEEIDKKMGKGSIKKALNFKSDESIWKKMGEKFNESVDSGSLGKSIADAFTKSVLNIGQNMGIDKAVAGAVDSLKGTLTFRGGFAQKPEMGELSGDKLARATAKKQEEQSADTQKLLQELITETKKGNEATKELKEEVKNSSKKGGTGGGTPPTP